MTTPNLELAEPPDAASPIALEERQSARALDALGPGWIAVLSRSTTTPPADAIQGARYIVPDGALGVWFGRSRAVAYRTPDGWEFRSPRLAWIALVLDEGSPWTAIYYDGLNWVGLPAGVFDLTSIDAADVTFQGYGLPGDPTDVDAALAFLYAAEIDHEARITSLETGGGGGGGNRTPDSHPTSADPADDEFETGTSIDTAGSRFTGATAWAWFNQGAATDTVIPEQGNLTLASGTGADSTQLVAQAAPSAPWRYRAKYAVQVSLNFQHAGMCIHNTGNGRAICFDIQYNTGFNLICVRYSALGTFNSSITGAISYANEAGTSKPSFFEIENDGTTLSFRYSVTGYDGTFVTFATELLSNYIGAVTHIGLDVNPGGAASPGRLYCDSFRRRS